jgi:hypothetical protein
MFGSQKNVFWQAFLVALLIFIFGLVMGYSIEYLRISSLERFNDQSLFYLFDAKVQNELIGLVTDCEASFRQNILFSDKIYNDYKFLEKYDNVNRLTESIIFEHRKYDLLRALFWATSIKIRKQCPNSPPNIVYLYQYELPSPFIRAKQDIFAKYLHGIQKKFGNYFLLVPLAGDNRVSSISVLMHQFNITTDELPVILIDEKIKITSIDDLPKIEDFLSSFILSDETIIRLN